MSAESGGEFIARSYSRKHVFVEAGRYRQSGSGREDPSSETPYSPASSCVGTAEPADSGSEEQCDAPTWVRPSPSVVARIRAACVCGAARPWLECLLVRGCRVGGDEDCGLARA